MRRAAAEEERAFGAITYPPVAVLVAVLVVVTATVVTVGLGAVALGRKAGGRPGAAAPGAEVPALPTSTIVYAVFSNTQAETGVYAMAPDGSGAHRIDPAVAGCMQGGMAAVRPDRRAILFSPGIRCGLMSVNVDGTGLKTIDAEAACLSGCDWSPDGRRIVFEKDGKVVLADAGGGHQTAVGPGRAPAWSPRGDVIAFQSPTGDLLLFDVASGATRTLAQAKGGLFWPAFDPTGARLVVENARFELFTVDVASGAMAPVCGTANGRASWSPAGDALAYDRFDDISICDVATGNVHAVGTTVGYAAQSPWWR